MRKTAYLALPELDMSNIATYELWYDYIKPKYGEKAKLYFMDTDSFIVQVKTYNIFKNFAENVKARFDTSNYKLNKPLPKGKNKKVIVLMKDELGEKIMKEFVGFRAKTYCYLTDNNNEDKKHRKDTKKWIVKGKTKCEDYKQLLINNSESTGWNHFNYSKAFLDIYKNIEEYNPNKKHKILIIFDIADMLCNKKHNPILTSISN